MSERWFNTPCRHCGGTGKTFYCAKCDVEEPGECLHEADPNYVDEEENE